MELKGSETEINLKTAFSGESQARNKYTYFASIAKKEGYEHIASIFLETAENEKEHAKIWHKYLYGKNATNENLQNAIEGEREEWSNMYKHFAEVAEKEGFIDIAKKFKLVAEVEKTHEQRFNELLNTIKDGSVFKKNNTNTKWKCRNCGYIHVGSEAPDMCPCCDHKQSYFEII